MWVEDWTTLAQLDRHINLFGNLRVAIGDRDLPGFSVPFEDLGWTAAKASWTNVGRALYVLMGLRQIGGTRSRKKPIYRYRVEIFGVWFRVTLTENRLLFVPLYGNGHPIGEYAELWMDYDQVKAELAGVKSLLASLLLKEVPKEKAEDWYRGQVHGDLFGDDR